MAARLPVRKLSSVLLVSTSYPASATDWRGRFIADMARHLAETQKLHLAVWAPPGELPEAVVDATTADEAAWLKRLMEDGGIAHRLRRRGPLALGTICGLLARLRSVYCRSDADLVHVNWLQNALPLAGSSKPALVTVLGTDFGLLKLPGMVRLLRRCLRGRPVILAPNAEWMAAELERDFRGIAAVRPIPFGVDEPWFKVQRAAAGPGPCRWLAVTRLTRGKLGPLFEWGKAEFRDGHELHLFGPRQEADIEIPDWVHYHGPTHPQELRDAWFPQAAGLITLSQHNEGRPQVVLEAMAAGLPVIASVLPAHNDVISHLGTGMLVDSPAGLAEALSFLAARQNNRDMGEAARAWVLANVGTWRDCAQRYLAAYETLLGNAA
jgi:glycosyltransferase involved in cell wall biosynthesis